MNRQAPRLLPFIAAVLTSAMYLSPAHANTLKTDLKALDQPCPINSAQEQKLDQALQDLARQCSITIAYSASATRKISIAAIPEDHHQTPRQWLTHWLAPTTFNQLTFIEVGDAAVTVVANNNPSEITPIDDSVFRLEEMLVTATGTHLRRYNLDVTAASSVPSELLQNQGLRSLWQTLRYSPFVSAGSSSHRLGSDGNGIASVALRGLPANNTLVLMDGKRTAGNGLTGDSVDLNAIPLAALERIDLLKNSASAIYGSDAVAGTVNFITRREFDGFEFSQNYGQSSYDDMHTYNSELLLGTVTDRYSTYVAARYFTQDGAMNRDRELSSSVDAREKGGIDRRSSATANSRIYLPSGGVISATDNNTYQLASADDYYDYAQNTTAISPLQQSQVFARASIALNQQMFLDSRISYSNNHSYSESAPAPIETAFSSPPLSVSRDNIYNPFGIELRDVRRRVTELGNRESTMDTEYWRFNSSLENEAGRDQSQWRMNLHWSRSLAESQAHNVINTEHLSRGIGANNQCLGQSVDGCTAINLLGAKGSIGAEQLNYLREDQHNSGRSDMLAASYDINLQPWQWHGDDILLAAGFEFRRESSQLDSDQTALIGALPATELDAQRDIFEAYAESSLPILQDQSAAHLLQLDLALRYSYYSDFGEHFSPKLALIYKPHEDWLFRADYTEGFRAPSLMELYHGDSYSRISFADPCSNVDIQALLPGCKQFSDPYHNQYKTHISANRELEPEQTKSHAFGIKYSPEATHQLSLSIDYFHIEQDNVISALSPNILAWRDASGIDDNLVERDSNGNIQLINSYSINGDQRQLEGFDYHASLQGPAFADFQYKSYVQATQMREFREYYSGGYQSNNFVGSFADVASSGYGALPEWKALAGLTLLGEQVDVHLNAQYISALDENIPRTKQTRDIDSWLIFNTKINLRTHDQRFAFELGIDNIFNTKPPFSAAASNNNFDARSHDLSGRFYFSKLTFRLD